MVLSVFEQMLRHIFSNNAVTFCNVCNEYCFRPCKQDGLFLGSSVTFVFEGESPHNSSSD